LGYWWDRREHISDILDMEAEISWNVKANQSRTPELCPNAAMGHAKRTGTPAQSSQADLERCVITAQLAVLLVSMHRYVWIVYYA
jgi:hypothetical protein